MNGKKSRASLFVCVMVALLSPVTYGQGVKQDAKDAGHAIGNGARDVGHATAHAARSVGHGAKQAGQGIGHGAKVVGHGIAQGTREGWDATKHAVKQVFHKGD